MTFQEARYAWETAYLLEALERHAYNRTHAARELGLQRTYFVRLLRERRIVRPLPSQATYRRGARAIPA